MLRSASLDLLSGTRSRGAGTASQYPGLGGCSGGIVELASLFVKVTRSRGSPLRDRRGVREQRDECRA